MGVFRTEIHGSVRNDCRRGLYVSAHFEHPPLRTIRPESEELLSVGPKIDRSVESHGWGRLNTRSNLEDPLLTAVCRIERYECPSGSRISDRNIDVSVDASRNGSGGLTDGYLPLEIKAVASPYKMSKLLSLKLKQPKLDRTQGRIDKSQQKS